MVPDAEEMLIEVKRKKFSFSIINYELKQSNGMKYYKLVK